jgi:hypothetical protein
MRAASQPSKIFLVSCAATVILTMLGILYLVSDALQPNLHEERALLCFGFAVMSACIAAATSPRNRLHG